MADPFKPPAEPTLPELYQKILIAGIYSEDTHRIFAIPYEVLAKYELMPQDPGAYFENLQNIADPSEAVAVLRDAWMRADGH